MQSHAAVFSGKELGAFVHLFLWPTGDKDNIQAQLDAVNEALKENNWRMGEMSDSIVQLTKAVAGGAAGRKRRGELRPASAVDADTLDTLKVRAWRCPSPRCS